MLKGFKKKPTKTSIYLTLALLQYIYTCMEILFIPFLSIFSFLRVQTVGGVVAAAAEEDPARPPVAPETATIGATTEDTTEDTTATTIGNTTNPTGQRVQQQGVSVCVVLGNLSCLIVVFQILVQYENRNVIKVRDAVCFFGFVFFAVKFKLGNSLKPCLTKTVNDQILFCHTKL